MAPRVFLLCILFTIGILTSRITGTSGIDLTLGFAQEPEDVVVGRGQPALLNCSAFTDPELGPVRLSWSLDDKPLVNEEVVISSPPFSLTPSPALSQRRVLMANGSLYFKKVVHKRAGGVSDQGTYRCIAKNTVGVLVSRPAQLRVAALSHNFTEVPTDQVVEEEDVVRFRCQIDSIPTALISWERNRAPLPQDSRYFVLSSGVLQIVGVQPSDAGSYSCIASNAVAKKQRRSPDATLKVIPISGRYRPPQFLMWPPATNETASAPNSYSTSLPLSSHPHLGNIPFMEVITKQGEDLVLECSASGSPVPQIHWSRAPALLTGETTIHKEVVGETTAGTNNLPLKTVQVQDGGAYYCIATNKNSENKVTSITQAIWVGVLAPPVFIRPPASQVFPTAKTVRFDCEVGLPPGPGSKLFPPLPPVVWLKDGKILDINGRVKQKQSELVLSDTVTNDSGLYQCVARTGKYRGLEMEAWSAARLLVNVSQYQPEPPHGLTCRPHSPTQVQLDWMAPPLLWSGQGSGVENHIKAYTVHYLPTDENGLEQQAVVLNKTFLVDKLTPYTNYTFYVRVYTEKAASDQSKKIVCRTGEGVPQAAPEIYLDTSSPTTLRLWWEPLEPSKARGVITEHKIQWRRHGNPSTNVANVKGYVHEYTITDLLPGKKYEVRVLAATKMGWPDVPDDQLKWKQFEVPSFDQQNVPSTPNVQLTVVNSTSIEVTWSIPKDEKIPLDGFRLYYRKQNGNQIGPINIPGNVFHYLLTGLEPQVQYKVMLKGYNQEGNGSMGVKAIYTLPPESSAHKPGGEDVPAPAPPAPPTSPDDPGGQQGITGDIEPPTGLEAQPTSPRSINLTWIPPSTSASYYTVSYNPVQSSLSVNTSTVKYIRSTSNSVEIVDLKPFTLYEFKVRSHDHKNHQGPYGDKVECITLEDVPSVPQDVQVKAKNTTCVQLSWKEPHFVNGAVRQYVVRYSTDPSIPLEKWALMKYPGNQYVAEINGLSPNIQYHINFRAETGAGEGEAVELIARPFPNSAVSGVTEPPNEKAAGEQNDQHLGIIVGIVIGVGFMAICGASFICRRQCQKSSSPDIPPGNSGRCGSSLGVGQHGLHVPGIGGHANGNGLCKDRGRGFVVGSGSGSLVQSLTGGGARGAGEAHEMEFFTPMLVGVPPEANAHLDTKGGYPNGQINGFKHSLLSNGRIPNGHVARGNVHITENPQYDSGTEARIPLPKHANRYTVNGGGLNGDRDGNIGVGGDSSERATNLLLGDSEEDDDEEEEIEADEGGGSRGSAAEAETTQLTCLSFSVNEDESGCHVKDNVGASEEDVKEDSGGDIPTREVVSMVTPERQQELARHEEEQHLFPVDGSGDACDHREDQGVAGSLVSKSGARRHAPHMLGFSMPHPPSTSTPLLVPKG